MRFCFPWVCFKNSAFISMLVGIVLSALNIFDRYEGGLFECVKLLSLDLPLLEITQFFVQV